VNRCRRQISGVLAVLEADRAARSSDYWFGDSIGHADIAVAAALRFIGDAHAGIISLADYPALSRHAAQHEALPVFGTIAQEFIPPA
jgi:glutathione S-transferase